MRHVLLTAALVTGCGQAKEEAAKPAEKQELPAYGKGGGTVIAVVKDDKKPQIATKPLPVRPLKVGETLPVGDLAIKLTSASVTGFLDDRDNSLAGLVVQFTVTCTNPKRIVTVPAQAGRARMTDDVGNAYEENIAVGRIADSAGLLWNRIRHKQEVRLQSSDGPRMDAVIFEKPVDGASRVTVDLDASVYGGDGVIRLELARADLFPPKAEAKEPKGAKK